MSDRLGGRGGEAVDRSCLQSCPRLHNVRKTRDRCVQVTEGWHGGRVVDGGGENGGRTDDCAGEAGGREGAVHGQCSETEYTEGGLKLE